LIRPRALEDGPKTLERSAPWLVPLLGVFLTLSALGPRAVFDDHVLALAARSPAEFEGMPPAHWDLFAFTTGDQAANMKLVEQGLMLPWWSDARLKVAFYRPLSSLFHRLDYALWPDSPRCMVLHSLAWLALTLHLVVRCYRRFELSPRLALLSGVLYAMDDARGPLVAWICNRNALIAATFGILALLAHDRWRREGRRAQAFVGPACLLLALLGGEIAVSALAYLAAYACSLESREGLRQRLQSLVPYAAVAAGWAALHVASGAAVYGSGTYVSPLTSPSAFLKALPDRTLTLVGAALGPLPSDLWLLGASGHAFFRWMTAGLVLVTALYALRSGLLHEKLVRFWGIAMCLAFVPIAASFPSDRLLVFANIGGMALVARIVEPLLTPALRRVSSVGRSTVALGFALVHGALAPLLLPLRAGQMQLIGRLLENATSYLDGVAYLEDKTIVIVNAPIDPFASYVQAERAATNKVRAKGLYWLTSSGSAALARRIDGHTLLIEREGGFLSTPFEIHYRAEPSSLALGSSVELAQMTATVQSVTTEGYPHSVSFRFRETLESAAYLFLVWKNDRYEPLDFGELEQPLRLPAQDLGKILAHAALDSP
jgi:hypothetical protein